MEGSLGGLQLLDLTPNSKHQKVFSVGQDPTAISDDAAAAPDSETPVKPNENETVDLYISAIELPSSGHDDEDEEHKALTFTLLKSDRLSTPMSSMRQADFGVSGRSESKINYINVTDLDLHLASLCYTHVPRFLTELTMSLDEFKSTAATLADSIQKAAAEVAKELVMRQKSEFMTATMSSSMFGNLNNESDATAGSTVQDTTDAGAQGKQTQFNFKMSMETPIIVLPRTESSSEVLVAHLGTILITNSKASDGQDETFERDYVGNNRLYLSMRDMNMYSFNEMDSKSRSGSTHIGLNHARRSSYKGTPILYNTSLEITIDHIPPDPPTMVSDYSSTTFGTDDSILQEDEEPTTIQVCGRIVSPLKLLLSKHVFEQVIQTVDNLTYDEDKLNLLPKTSASMLDSGNFDGMFVSPRSEDMEPPSLEMPSIPTASSSQSSLMEGTPDPPTTIKAKFDLPEFSVQLQGDLSDGDQGLVDISIKNFSVNFDKSDPYTTSIDVTLQSVIMEDLLQDANSKHRYLIVSSSGSSQDTLLPQTFLSTSLPSIASLPSPIAFRPASLPSSLDNSPGHQYGSYHPPGGLSGYQPAFRTSSSMSSRTRTSPGQGRTYPSTPPPSIDVSMEDIAEESMGK